MGISALGTGGTKNLNTVDVRSPELKRVMYRMKKCGGTDEERSKIAARHLQLLAGRPRITLPESVVWYLLEDRKEVFEPQGDVAGGRSQWGGEVVDFWLPDRRVIIRVQGEWWHSLPGAKQRDAEGKAILQRAIIGGQRVSAVVDVWEHHLMSCRRRMVVDRAVVGVEVPR